MARQFILNLSSLLVDGPQDRDGRLIIQTLPESAIIGGPASSEISAVSESSTAGPSTPPHRD